MTTPAPSMYELEGRPAREDVLRDLAAVPLRLRVLVAAASKPEMERPVAGGEWSAFQVVCHMRDGGLVYSSRFRWIIFNDDPVLPSMDEENWVAAARDTVDDLPAILDEFTAFKSDLVRVLTRLSDDAWSRTGRHETLGLVRLEPYVRHQLAHEEMHLVQIAAALSAPAPQGNTDGS